MLYHTHAAFSEWDPGNEDEKKEELQLWQTAEIKFKESTGSPIRRIDFREPGSEHQVPDAALHIVEHAIDRAHQVEMHAINEPDELHSNVSNNINSNNTMITTNTQEAPSSAHAPNLNQNQEVLPPSSDFETAVQQQLANNVATVELQEETSDQSSSVGTEESSTSKASPTSQEVVVAQKRDDDPPPVADPDLSHNRESHEEKSSSEST